jgi:DNA-binding LacI/PurR family transcriptional regulator
MAIARDTGADVKTVVRRSAGDVAAVLRQRIERGWIGQGQFLPSVRRLGSEYGAAPKTMHRALKILSGEGLVAAHPRRGFKVVGAGRSDAAAPLAMLLSAGREESGWNLLVQVLIGVFETLAAASGRSLLVVAAGGSEPREVVAQLAAAGAAGVLVDSADAELLAAISAAGIPTVMIDSWTPEATFDAVVQDGFVGGMIAARELARRGHKRIAWLGFETRDADPQIIERFSGAVGGLASVGLGLPDELRLELPRSSGDAAYQASLRMLKSRGRPTAVLALWSPIMTGLLRAARELKLEPGRDFDVIGWCTEEGYGRDHLALFAGKAPAPAITWSVADMAAAALKRLEERRADPDMPRMQIKVSPRLRCE